MNIFKNLLCDAQCVAIGVKYNAKAKRLESLKKKNFDKWCRVTFPVLSDVSGKIIQLESFHSNSGADGYYGEDVAVATEQGKIHVVRDYGHTFKCETYDGNKIVRFEKGIFEYE